MSLLLHVGDDIDTAASLQHVSGACSCGEPRGHSTQPKQRTHTGDSIRQHKLSSEKIEIILFTYFRPILLACKNPSRVAPYSK